MGVSTGLILAGQPVRHNGGTLFGGNVAGTGPMNNDVNQGETRTSVFASVVATGVTVGVQKANVSRNFATQGEREYIIAGGSTTTLGGVASPLVKQFQTSVRDMLNVNLRTTRKTLHIQGWDYVTGAPTGTTSTTDDNFGTDNEATNIGRADAGSFTVNKIGTLPENDDYSLKTN